MDGYGESSAAVAAGTDNILDLVDIDAPEAVPKAIDELFASAEDSLKDSAGVAAGPTGYDRILKNCAGQLDKSRAAF